VRLARKGAVGGTVAWGRRLAGDPVHDVALRPQPYAVPPAHVYAVGRNAEAARRAGIVVSRIRISVFVICSGMAAVSGMVAASLL
jgi:hypothetical protein